MARSCFVAARAGLVAAQASFAAIRSSNEITLQRRPNSSISIALARTLSKSPTPGNVAQYINRSEIRYAERLRPQHPEKGVVEKWTASRLAMAGAQILRRCFTDHLVLRSHESSSAQTSKIASYQGRAMKEGGKPADNDEVDISLAEALEQAVDVAHGVHGRPFHLERHIQRSLVWMARALRTNSARLSSIRLRSTRSSASDRAR